MSGDGKTARERFVEAMRAIVEAAKIDLGNAPYFGGYGEYFEAACEAFADAECDELCAIADKDFDPNDGIVCQLRARNHRLVRAAAVRALEMAAEVTERASTIHFAEQMRRNESSDAALRIGSHIRAIAAKIKERTDA